VTSSSTNEYAIRAFCRRPVVRVQAIFLLKNLEKLAFVPTSVAPPGTVGANWQIRLNDQITSSPKCDVLTNFMELCSVISNERATEN